MKVTGALSISLTLLAGFLAEAQQRGLVITLPNGVAMEFVRIEPGQFTMGCSAGDKQCAADEMPAHQVRITRGFEIGKYEVTSAQWQSVMVTRPAVTFKGDGDNRAYGFVGFDFAVDFVARLNARKDGYRYRLPSEAEWEYAARAGTTGPYAAPSPDAVAWIGQNVFGRPELVGQKKPNAWGLYDMLGNAWEFTQDFYDPKYYSRSPESDPKGPASGQYRVLRGGSSLSAPGRARVSVRHFLGATAANDYYGFRVVREAVP
jgi:formylglycine-generating enzyme required for sulfatase activity